MEQFDLWHKQSTNGCFCEIYCLLWWGCEDRPVPGRLGKQKVIVAHILLSRQCPAPTSQRAKQKFQELDGNLILSSPAYYPELAPAVFGLFHLVTVLFRWCSFDSLRDIGVLCFSCPKKKNGLSLGHRVYQTLWVKAIEYNILFQKLRLVIRFFTYWYTALSIKSVKNLYGAP